MDQSEKKRMSWIPVLAIGSVWGLSEAALGMALRGVCARFVTGSAMTGMAILFMAITSARLKRMAALLVILGVATLYKLLDALLLGLPVIHGAVANPIFAFYTEIFAFILVFKIMEGRLREKRGGQALMGGMSALVAVNLFPLVKFATGIPACVVPGTGYPLALYYAPVAIGVSAISCPLGFYLGEKMAALEGKTSPARFPRLATAALHIAPLLCPLLLIVMRTA